MRYLIVALLMTGCINMTPRQEAIFHQEQEPAYVSAQELRELLPAFANIPDGQYQLVPRGTMPAAEWQNPRASELFRPVGWDCRHYSVWANDKMPDDAAFGVAWNKDHAVNWFVDTEKNVILFEPQDYRFIRMGVSRIEL